MLFSDFRVHATYCVGLDCCLRRRDLWNYSVLSRQGPPCSHLVINCSNNRRKMNEWIHIYSLSFLSVYPFLLTFEDCIIFRTSLSVEWNGNNTKAPLVFLHVKCFYASMYFTYSGCVKNDSRMSVLPYWLAVSSQWSLVYRTSIGNRIGESESRLNNLSAPNRIVQESRSGLIHVIVRFGLNYRVLGDRWLDGVSGCRDDHWQRGHYLTPDVGTRL